MQKMRHVAIGIQARSTSKRFPRKEFELIGDKPLLTHVIDSANHAASYINRYSQKSNIFVTTHLLVPKGDEIVNAFSHLINIHEGDESDVLSRYLNLVVNHHPDFVVRITGDCPFVPNYLITKHIKVAVNCDYDYTSNVFENSRVSIDGYDVEVMSRRAMAWLATNVTEQSDKEHVTTLLRKKRPSELSVGHLIGYTDLSNIKLSVDTKEDLERVRKQHEKLSGSIEEARLWGGRQGVHRV